MRIILKKVIKMEKTRRYVLFLPLALFVLATCLLTGLNNIMPAWLVIIIIFIIPAVIVYFIPKDEEETTEPEQPTTPAPTTPAPVPIWKRIRINWTIVWIVLALFLFYVVIVFLGMATIEETEQRAEMNAFRPESLSGVTIIKQGNNFLVAKGEKDGGRMTLVSEEFNPCIQFNYSGGNSTLEVSIDEIFYGDDKHGSVFLFSNPAGLFSTCDHKGKGDNNKKKKIKVEVVVEKNDTIRIWNYKVWKRY